MGAAAAYAALRKTSASSGLGGTFSSSRRLLAGGNHRRKSSTRTVRYSASALVPSTVMETCLTTVRVLFSALFREGLIAPSRGKICTRLRSAFSGRLEKRNARRCTAARASWHISCTATRA